MLGITCALYDEAYEIIRLLKRQKSGSTYHYTGKIQDVPVTLFLTKPALKKNKKNLIEWIKINKVSVLLQTGYCGALTNRYQPGDVCQISRVMRAHENEIAVTPGETHSLITVDFPVLTLEGKEDILRNHSAELVDMESWHICHLVLLNFPGIKMNVLKIVGDIPGEELLMNHEINMRSFFIEHCVKNKLKIILKTGWSFFSLYRRKRLLQKTLKNAVIQYIADQNQ